MTSSFKRRTWGKKYRESGELTQWYSQSPQTQYERTVTTVILVKIIDRKSLNAKVDIMFSIQEAKSERLEKGALKWFRAKFETSYILRYWCYFKRWNTNIFQKIIVEISNALKQYGNEPTITSVIAFNFNIRFQ